MKKSTALVIASVMALSLVACGSDTESAEVAANKTVQTQTDITEEQGTEKEAEEIVEEIGDEVLNELLNGDFSRFSGSYTATDGSNAMYGGGKPLENLELQQDGSVTGGTPSYVKEPYPSQKPKSVTKNDDGSYLCIITDKSDGVENRYFIYPEGTADEYIGDDAFLKDTVYIRFIQADGGISEIRYYKGEAPEVEVLEATGQTVEFVEPPAEDFEYNYDAAIGGVKITKYTGDAEAIRFPAEIDGDPVKQIQLSSNSIITQAELPDSVIDIAFGSCKNLKYIIIPDSITSIGEWAFSSCDSLTSIAIPDSVTCIGGYAFMDCSSLTEITMPDSVISIDAYAFTGCSRLAEIAIPDSVTSIGAYAFAGCESLTQITIPDSVTEIGEGAFSNCSSLTEITIPDSVTSIGAYAFTDCSSLTEITIPDGVTIIGPEAFRNCNNLTSVTLPDNGLEIYDKAFSGCTSLRNLTIPDSVTVCRIKYNQYPHVFSGCDGLTVTYQGQEYTYANDPDHWWN